MYAAVAVSALMAVGAQGLAEAQAPLAAVVKAGRLSEIGPAVRIGAAVASLGVLLSLLAGLSRTLFAMASNADLPRWFAAVHPARRVPHRAELAIGAVVMLVAATVDLREAIGFSSFGVLLYYGIANAAAFTQPPEQRRWPRALQVAGVGGCLLLAFSLPIVSVASGAAVVAVEALAFALRRLRPKGARRRQRLRRRPGGGGARRWYNSGCYGHGFQLRGEGT